MSALLDNPASDQATSSASAEKQLVAAAIGNAAPAVGSVSQLALSMIEANPFQPRSEFDEQALRELAESIRTQGIIQPITVRRMSADRYQIISGERRYKASKLAGLETVPVYIRTANDQAMLEMALVENIQRENLNALEISISYQRLLEECNLTQEQLGERVGKDRSTVTNYLRLLKLPPQVQFAIRDGKISMGHARAILATDDIGLQLKLFNDILSNDLSVRKAEDLVRTAVPKKASKGGNPAPEKKANRSSEIRNLEDRLSYRYETKIDIRHKDNGAGQIVINYFSTDDLNRLMDMLDYD